MRDSPTWAAALVRHDYRSERRQHVRRMPFASARIWDSQSIAIGIDNNGIVGPDRAGPRNQRRSPMVLNTAFYPALMWNCPVPDRSRRNSVR